ncbi:GCN5-related N-acetyltransferase, partial [mine drainage metagenome]
EVDSRIEYRGKGIGDRLLKAGISEISSFGGMRKIKLGVIADQKATIKLYERNGFSWVGKLSEELFLDGEFHDQIIMEKFI